MHLPLKAGRFPERAGEIALPEFLLTGLNAGAQIGDSVSLTVEDLSNHFIDIHYQLVGVILQNTHRRDMDYSYTETHGVTQNPPMDAPSPCIFLSAEDAAAFTDCYYNLCITFPEQWYTLPDDAPERALKQQASEQIEKAGGIITPGGAHAFIMTAQSGQSSASEALTFSETTDTFVMRRLFYIMAIVAAIALVSGVIAVMPERIRSLRLLKCIGMKNSRLAGIFIAESGLLWMTGTACGIAAGCGVHEVLLTMQSALGQPKYRGYFAEWLVQQQTLSPLPTALLLSAAITAASMVVPVWRVLHLRAVSSPARVQKSRRCGNSRSAVFSKMFSCGGISALQCVSLVLVLCASVFAFLYHTGSGKGGNYPFLEYRTDSDSSFFVQNGIDMKQAQIDAVLTGQQPAFQDWGNTGTVCGITPEIEASLHDLGGVYAWGAYSGSLTVFYANPEDAPPLMEAYRAPYNQKWTYYEQFKDKAFYMIPILLCNDRMLAELGAEADANVIWAAMDGAPPYEAGDTVPLTTALFNQNENLVELSTVRQIPVTVDQNIRITNALLQGSPYLNACRGFFGAQTIIMSAEYASKIGMYGATYTGAYLKLNAPMQDAALRSAIASKLDSTASFVTLQTLERSLKQQRLLEYASVFLLFAMIFSVSMIGIFNILRMQLSRSLPNLRALHQLGMAVHRIQKMLIKRALCLPLLAVILTAGLTLCFQKTEKLQFDKYAEKITEQQHLLGGLDSDAEGSVLFGGKDILKMNDDTLSEFRRVHIGYVFQFFNLVPELTARENILLPLLIGNEKPDEAFLSKLTDRLGISQRLSHLPAQLSGGQQQRAAIARALIRKPEVLLCDEPTGNLDSAFGQEVVSLLRQLREENGQTIIMVTHDPIIAQQADCVIRIEDGMISE